eukprot:8413627-Pyramimonas_sp.AAC.1
MPPNTAPRAPRSAPRNEFDGPGRRGREAGGNRGQLLFGSTKPREEPDALLQRSLKRAPRGPRESLKRTTREPRANPRMDAEVLVLVLVSSSLP